MNTRVLKLALAAGLIASLASTTAVFAGGVTRWTGADYCATQNSKDEWALVGGAACNQTASSNPNASWKQAWIIDFVARTATNAYDTSEVENLGGTLDAALATLTADYATDGWMYVANKNTNQKNIIYAMVKIASCSGASEWYAAPC